VIDFFFSLPRVFFFFSVFFYSFILLFCSVPYAAPNQATVPTSKPIQQSLFPAWHDRRSSNSANTLLEGTRKSGSFELLQGIVKEKEQEEEEQDKPLPSLPSKNVPEKVNCNETTSVPSILVNQAEKKQKCQSRCVKFMEQ
jgi:Cdc6-like AAA superfamily ATPase